MRKCALWHRLFSLSSYFRFFFIDKSDADSSRALLKPGVYAISLPGEEMDEVQNMGDDHYEDEEDLNEYEEDEDYDNTLAGDVVDSPSEGEDPSQKQSSTFDAEDPSKNIKDENFDSDFD